jgi:hypothetical protein
MCIVAAEKDEGFCKIIPEFYSNLLLCGLQLITTICEDSIHVIASNVPKKKLKMALLDPRYKAQT